MSYETQATSSTPALIIYVLDVSVSMGQPLNGARRVDVVMDALGAALRQMVFRSTKGARVSPRYRIGMFAYSHHVFDLLDGIKTVDEVAGLGIPELSPMRTTDTARAFAQVEKLLQREIPSIKHCPAPLVCHMTDGEYTGDDPEPFIQRIRQMSVPDGNVLVENIFISDRILPAPVTDPQRWPGILADTQLESAYARKLCAMSSPLPETYRQTMLESGYGLAPEALMMLPGMNPELVEMGFVMSAATPILR
jgi:hypothetical protein